MKIESTAAGGRKEGFTLAEVEQFCAHARVMGADGSERIGGAVSIGGKQYRLSVTVEGSASGEERTVRQ